MDISSSQGQPTGPVTVAVDYDPIKVVPGDRVTVGVSPYDPVRGIITFRAR